MWEVSLVILLILGTAHVKVTSEQEHNVTKREIDQQIIGGSAVSMPTAVLILIKPDEVTTNSCSGTILSEDIVLSAGHCFDIPGSYANVTTIVAGISDLRNYLFVETNNAQILNVEWVTIHPRYRYIDGGPGEQEELIWDLALIKLSSKMELETNPNMEAVKLPPPGMRHVGKIVQVGGWWRYSPNSGSSLVHQAIDLIINSDEKCSDTYDVGEYLPSLMFCAGERGQTTCRGDSGSGALFNWNNKQILIGVLSFGTKGCKTASVFQRVEKSLPWIFRETNIRCSFR
jgi:secreted trypsin-like serine protease